jgi:hypothetical protein
MALRTGHTRATLVLVRDGAVQPKPDGTSARTGLTHMSRLSRLPGQTEDGQMDIQVGDDGCRTELEADVLERLVRDVREAEAAIAGYQEMLAVAQRQGHDLRAGMDAGARSPGCK